MKILVCLKQVPDRNQNFEITDDKQGIKTEGLTFVENDFDRYAVEAALQLKSKEGGEVVVCTVGPSRAQEALRKALAMGADWGIHIEDEGLEDADPFVVSQLIAAAVKEDEFDLILAGVQSEDQAYSQTGPMVAHLLDLPHVTTVVKLETLEDNRLRVKRELEGGSHEVVSLPFPALVTIQTGINNPRYPTLPGIMKAKSKKVRKPSLEELGLSSDIVSQRMTEVLEYSHPPKREGGEILEGSPDEVASRLVEILKDEIKVL